MIDYNKRLVEVDEILRYLSEEDLLKIPENVRQTIKDNKSKEYIWKYDETKPLKEQNVSRDTIAILSYLNMEYLLNDEQRRLMQQIHELNEKKIKEVKKYELNDLFKRDELKKEEPEKMQQQSLVVYEENFLKKIINKIKSFFTK